MRVSINQTELSDLLDRSVRALAGSDMQPVLRSFRLSARNNQLTVVGSDLDLTIVARTDQVDVMETGQALFEGRRMREMIRSLDASDVVEVSSDGDGGGKIRSGRTLWEVRLSDAAQYPSLPDFDVVRSDEVSTGHLLDALEMVSHAVSDDAVRTGLRMVNVADEVMTAGDAAQFAQVELAAPDMNISAMAVPELVRVLKSAASEVVWCGTSETHLVFEVDDTRMIVTTPVAEFPDLKAPLFDKVVGNDEELHVDPDQLAKAVARVRIVADPQTSVVVLTLSDNELVVSAKDKFGAEAEESLDVGWTHGARVAAFNHAHLTNLLKVFPGQDFIGRFGKDSKTKPSPMVADGGGFTGVVTQIRTDLLS